MIEFVKFTDEEQGSVDRIVDRAKDLVPNVSPLEVRMDISAVHAQTPLRLEEFAAADDGNFGHDLYGILSHLNRLTGEMGDCFVPRFTA